MDRTHKSLTSLPQCDSAARRCDSATALCESDVIRFQKPGVNLPPNYNYIAVFLTFRCPYRCSYCINRFEGNACSGYKELSGQDWIDFFKRLEGRDVPVTLQGGEPGMHPDFIQIVEEVSKIRHLDILSNLTFNLEEFVSRIDPALVNREAPYAPIRASYHPEQMSLDEIIARVKFLMSAGFRVGLYGVLHPAQLPEIKHAEKVCLSMGIDFRTKPFLGFYKDKLLGKYAFPDACTLKEARDCECAPSELLIAPDGSIAPCHHHLYNKVGSIGNMRDPGLLLSDDFRKCSYYGHCNPCDIKVKNNRFQQFGHVSVRIKF